MSTDRFEKSSTTTAWSTQDKQKLPSLQKTIEAVKDFSRRRKFAGKSPSGEAERDCETGDQCFLELQCRTRAADGKV
jgi:hypothetical protein